MQSRDGPAAVRGDALRRTPLVSGLGRRRRGSPESEDLPPAVGDTIEPLAEGRIRVQASPRRPRGAPRRCSPARPARRQRRPAAHRLAVADGDRVAVRDRRRPAGRRGRRPVRLPDAAHRARRSPASPRTWRRSPATSPTSSSSRTTRTASSPTLRGLGIRVLVQDAAKTIAEAYAQIVAARQDHGPRETGGHARRADEEADRRARRRRARSARAG